MVGLFGVSSAVIWGGLGAVLAIIGSGRVWPLVAGVLYSGVFFVSWASALRLEPIGVAWGVPALWVRGQKSIRTVAVWAVFLGPGVVTRNPYPSMWVLVFCLAGVGGSGQGVIAGVLVGLAHGVMRAVGIVSAAWRGGGSIAMLARMPRWLVLDAGILLASGCLLSSVAVLRITG